MSASQGLLGFTWKLFSSEQKYLSIQSSFLVLGIFLERKSMCVCMCECVWPMLYGDSSLSDNPKSTNPVLWMLHSFLPCRCCVVLNRLPNLYGLEPSAPPVKITNHHCAKEKPRNAFFLGWSGTQCPVLQMNFLFLSRSILPSYVTGFPFSCLLHVGRNLYESSVKMTIRSLGRLSCPPLFLKQGLRKVVFT